MNLRQALKSKAPEDYTTPEGKFRPAGTKLIRGVACPKCGQFFPMAYRLVICGACGHQEKKQMKPYEVKRYVKNLKRKQHLEKDKKNM